MKIYFTNYFFFNLFPLCFAAGALPPEVRRRQARLFNDPENDYSIMVASDAVGMGLNLNIGRVVFHTMHKSEGAGKKLVPVSFSAVKQIAGRAGRRSSQFNKGRVTCFDVESIPMLSAHLAAPLKETATPQAGLVPEFEQFEAFASQRPEIPFSELLQAFEKEAVLQGRYFFCRQEAVAAAASLVEKIPGLSLKDMYTFALAPANAADPRIMAALLHWAKRYAAGLPCPLDLSPPSKPPGSVNEMRVLESAHAVVMLWSWLSYRYEEETFPNRDAVQELGEEICFLLGQGLENITALGKDQKVENNLNSYFDEEEEEEESDEDEWSEWINGSQRTTRRSKAMREPSTSTRKNRRKPGKKSFSKFSSKAFGEFGIEMFAAFEAEVETVMKATKQQQRARIKGKDKDKEESAGAGDKGLVRKRKPKQEQRRKRRQSTPEMKSMPMKIIMD